MPDPRDTVDWSLPIAAGESGDTEARPAGEAQPWLRLWFECSKQYARAHRAADGSAYVGRCPTCGASVRFPIGTGGTSERFFRVSC